MHRVLPRRQVSDSVPGSVVSGGASGASADLGFIWLLADTLNAMMAIPNLIALALLSPIVFKLTKEFFASGGATEEAGSSQA